MGRSNMFEEEDIPEDMVDEDVYGGTDGLENDLDFENADEEEDEMNEMLIDVIDDILMEEEELED